MVFFHRYFLIFIPETVLNALKKNIQTNHDHRYTVDLDD